MGHLPAANGGYMVISQTGLVEVFTARWDKVFQCSLSEAGRGQCHRLCSTPAGTTLLAWSNGTIEEVRITESGLQQVRVFQAPFPLYAVACSPSHIVVSSRDHGGDGCLAVLDYTSGEVVRFMGASFSERVTGLCFLGPHVYAAGVDGAVAVYDPCDGTCWLDFGQSCDIHGIADICVIQGDQGPTVAVSHSYSDTVCVYDTDRGACLSIWDSDSLCTFVDTPMGLFKGEDAVIVYFPARRVLSMPVRTGFFRAQTGWLAWAQAYRWTLLLVESVLFYITSNCYFLNPLH